MLFSNEGMQFSTSRSKLGQEISLAAELVLTKKNELMRGRDKPFTEAELSGYIRDYTSAIFVPALKAAVLKYVGLEIRHVTISPKLTGDAAIIPIVGSGTTTLDLKRAVISSGQVGVPAEIIKKLKKSFDEDTAKINNVVLERLLEKSNQPFAYYGILYIDPQLFFCPKENIGDEAKPFTADEITAIFLHELGHCCTLMEYVITERDRYVELIRLDNELVVAGDPVSQRKALTVVSKSATEDSPVEKRLVAGANQLVAEEEAVVAGKAKVKEPSLFSKLAISLNTFIRKQLYLLSLVKVVAKRAKENVITDEVRFSGAGDVAHTRYKKRDVEILADRFVTYNGFGSSLATALTKYNHNRLLLEAMNPSKNKDDILYPYVARRLVADTAFIRMVCDVATDEHVYELLSDRIATILRDIYGEFAAKRVPPRLASAYKAQIDTLNNLLNTAKRQENSLKGVLWRKLYALTQRLSRGDSLADIMIGRDFDRDYNAILTSISNIGNSPLFYQANLIEDLIRSREAK